MILKSYKDRTMEIRNVHQISEHISYIGYKSRSTNLNISIDFYNYKLMLYVASAWQDAPQ